MGSGFFGCWLSLLVRFVLVCVFSFLPLVLPAWVLLAKLLFSANNSSKLTVGLYLKLRAFGPGICTSRGR